MKSLLFPAVIGILCLSACASAQTPASSKRTAYEICDELITVLKDSTATIDEASALFIEYADTLYSMQMNSAPDDIRLRIEAQDCATDALWASTGYLMGENGKYESDVPMRFAKVLESWWSISGDLGTTFVKEIVFTSGQETEREKKDVISAIVKTGQEIKTRVILPAGKEENYPVVMFCNNAPEGSEIPYDLDNTESLYPNHFEESDGNRAYDFEGDEFFKMMLSYDRMFISYGDGFGGIDSVVQALGRFREQVKEQGIKTAE